ncbi:MAG: NAD(P)/FAD-dependent oxidoreductase [Planctomycetota bacterium]|nr:MAG: NAD(P)/FAD-dependent oxidoreductase [Planctomycetota bacterium]
MESCVSCVPANLDRCARQWDAVVVGAGPCGSIAALQLARRGLRTLLVERSDMPRFKVCGGCLAHGGIATLERLGLAHTLAGAEPLNRLVVCSDGRSASVPISRMLGVSRTDLDLALLSAARQAGADVIVRTAANVDQDGTCRLRMGADRRTVSARAVIIADGLGGASVRHDPAFAWRVQSGSKIGLGGVCTQGGCPDASVVMCIAREGYVGFAPLQGGRMLVAAAVDPKAIRDAGGARILAERIVEFSGAPICLPCDLELRGTPTLTRKRNRVEAGRVLIAGDAAGYVEPFTGEGMTWAIRTGELCARQAEKLVDGTFSAGQWSRLVSRELGAAQRRCQLVRHLVARPALVRACMGLIRVLPPIGGAVSGRFGRVAQGGAA